MIDWSACSAVERDPEKVSGSWVFPDTRVLVVALFENLEGGADAALEYTIERPRPGRLVA